MISTQLEKLQFTVTQYHKMNEAGILTEDDRVELIRGEILKMSPVGKRHAACVDFISNFLYAALASKVIVRVQNPIILNDLSEPQPDISLVKFRTDFYRSGLPQTKDILLLIEVADSTIDYDRDVKIPLYAENGILEVWLIDIKAETITIYRQPTPTGYKDVKILQRGDSLSILAFPEINLTLNDIFG
ncbi:MAG TPA: Uma2 family endonuclease [Nostocaceae cyanobacterium]|nr:Uma2 family endonuclease [Nostocaceae cyanobacterium]